MAKGFDNLTDLLNTGTEEEFWQYKATSSDSDALKVTADNDEVQVGSYDIQIKQLAQISRIKHDGVEEIDTALSTTDAEFVLDIGGTKETIDIIANETTLEDLRDAINELDGVKASIVNTGTDTNPYRLVISGENTGEDNYVEVSSDTTLSGFGDANFTVVQEAKDSLISIDGIDVERETNTLTDVVDGITFELLKDTKNDDASYNTIEAEVQMNDTGIQAKISTFLNAFNDVANFVQSQNPNAQNKTANGPLSGDYMALSLESRLRNMIYTSVEVGGERINAANIGIETSEFGTLQLNEETFKEALENNPEQIRALFVEENGSVGIAAQFSRFLEDLVDPIENPFSSQKESIESSIKLLDNQIESAGIRLEKYEARLVKEFTNLEKLVSSFQSTQNYLMQSLYTTDNS